MDVLYPFLLTWLLVTGEAQDCTDPVGGANMNLKDGDILLKSFPEGITVTFVCSVGYVSGGGSGATKCSAGVWSAHNLRCTKKSCGSAGEVENGNIDYSAGNEFGDTITIRCNQGYILVGKAQMTCGDKGWLGRLPQCEVVVCDPPSPIKSGSLFPDKVSYDYRDVIQYTCDLGLTLNGTNSISCSADGKFKPDPPTCIRVECPEPKIDNAEWVEGSRPPHVYRAIVTYRCLPRFVMKGERTLTCQIGNKWSPPEPVCEISTIPTKTVTTPTKTTTTTTSAAPPGPDLGTIAKGVGGFLAALVLFLVLFFGCRKLFEKMYRKRDSYNSATLLDVKMSA